MSVFIVVQITKPEKMREVIQAKFKHAYELKNGDWMLAGRMTVLEVCERLGLDTDENSTTENDEAENDVGSAIVFGVKAYFGCADMHVWDWLEVKFDAD